MLTVGEVLRKSAAFLERKGCPAARLDAELLLAHVLKADRLALYLDFAKPLTPAEEARYRELVVRRGERVPVAQLCGEKEFMSLPFFVTPAVLAPRPETEHLVECALEVVKGHSGPRPLKAFEVGAGSGVVAICLACYARGRVRITASDVSPEALEVARRNAARHGVEDEVRLIEADFFGDRGGPFDLIVSNPPYVSPRQRPALDPDVAEHEPAVALFAERDGFGAIARLLAESPERLRSGGALLFEIGQGQAAGVERRVADDDRWESRGIVNDLRGIPRVVRLRRR